MCLLCVKYYATLSVWLESFEKVDTRFVTVNLNVNSKPLRFVLCDHLRFCPDRRLVPFDTVFLFLPIHMDLSVSCVV